MPLLLTGAAGFIGYHTTLALLQRGESVIGVDTLNEYYDPALKRARLARLERHAGFRFYQTDITDRVGMAALAEAHPDIDAIVHMAAQAGVRYSMENPCAYVLTNVLGHVVLLEIARHLPRLRHVVYASSSSVYGLNQTLPFSETDRVDQPLSPYAATKRAAELMSFVYSRLYDLPQTGLRFFTVYGPWGRPDMAYYQFAQAIMTGAPVRLFEEGALRRSFTYIDDAVAGVLGCLDKPPLSPECARLLNIGHPQSVSVEHLLTVLEHALGRPAIREKAPRPAADVTETLADVDSLTALTGFITATPLEVGIPHFVEWFQAYHKPTEIMLKTLLTDTLLTDTPVKQVLA